MILNCTFNVLTRRSSGTALDYHSLTVKIANPTLHNNNKLRPQPSGVISFGSAVNLNYHILLFVLLECDDCNLCAHIFATLPPLKNIFPTTVLFVTYVRTDFQAATIRPVSRSYYFKTITVLTTPVPIHTLFALAHGYHVVVSAYFQAPAGIADVFYD